MKLLYDFFPVLLFFVVYKFYGEIPAGAIEAVNVLPFMSLVPGRAGDAIFLATAVAIAASAIQVSAYWLKNRRFEKMHLISLGVITLFGGASLILDNPWFIKWKPTVAYWLFAAAFLGSRYIGQRTLAERLMGHAISVPAPVWRRVNLGWAGFFIFAGCANLYVAYRFSESTWVDFKLFGLLSLTLLFVFAQALYLARFMQQEQEESG